MAILGNAAGTTARALGRYFPDTSVDAVEIDSELTTLGRRWFDLRNPRMRVHHEDARPYLRRTSSNYDAIMLDVYRQPYIPFYLATREFFELVRDHLNPGGVVVVNVGHPEGQDDLEKVLSATMGEVFRTVARDPSEDTNTQVIGTNGPPVEDSGCAAPWRACPPICGRWPRSPPAAWRPHSREATSTRTTKRRSSGWWTSRSWIMRRTGSRQTREGA